MAENIYGLTAIKMGDPELDGGMCLAPVEVFGQTVTGSAIITTTDPTTSDIECEEKDDPILSITNKGTMNLAFSTYNIDPASLQKAFGGTVTGDTWEAPDSSPEIIQSIRLETKNSRFVELPKVKLNPRLGIAFDKTTPGKIDFTCTILAPDKAGEPKMRVGKIV